MAPTPERMMRILTFSSDSFVSVSASTSADPWTSALMMIGSSLMALGDLLLQRLEREARRLGERRLFLHLGLPKQRDLPRLRGVFDRLERVARPRQRRQAEHLDRERRPGDLDLPTAVIDERAHLAEDRARDDGVADVQRAVLDENRRDRPASLVEFCLEHGPDAARFGFALRSPMSVTSRIISSSSARFWRFFADTSTMTVLPPHSSGIRPSSDSSRFTRSGLASGLSILLIATMIGTPAAFAWSIASRVCGITPSSAATTRMTMSVTRPAGAHQRERFVTGRVEEHHAAVVDLHVIGPDVLRDAARFALGDAGLPDAVEQRGLAVVNVPHDGDDRGARHAILRVGVHGLDLEQFLFEAAEFHLGAELPRDHRRGVDVQRRVDGHHDPLVEEFLENILRAEFELLGEILDRHAFGERNRACDRRRGHRHRHLGHARRFAPGAALMSLSKGRSSTHRRTEGLAGPRGAWPGTDRRWRARPWRLGGSNRLRRQRTRTTHGRGARRQLSGPRARGSRAARLSLSRQVVTNPGWPAAARDDPPGRSGPVAAPVSASAAPSCAA